jgi:hypothetical protein
MNRIKKGGKSLLGSFKLLYFVKVINKICENKTDEKSSIPTAICSPSGKKPSMVVLRRDGRRRNQGCQMVYFQTKNPVLGKFWRALDWKMSIYFKDIWNILQTFGIFYNCLVHFVFIRYFFPVLVSFTKKNLAILGATFQFVDNKNVFCNIQNPFGRRRLRES